MEYIFYVYSKLWFSYGSGKFFVISQWINIWLILEEGIRHMNETLAKQVNH